MKQIQDARFPNGMGARRSNKVVVLLPSWSNGDRAAHRNQDILVN